MSESFVDLTYRGLSLGKRVKLTELRPRTGYVELAQPMPVGTRISIATDESVALEATVVGVREQTGSDKPPGMVLQPVLEGAAAAWWTQRVTLPEAEKPVPLPPKLPAQPPPLPPRVAAGDTTPPVIIGGRRVTKPGVAVPELVDDGQDTGVMESIDPDLLVPDDPAPRAIEDAPKTTAMDAVDLAALGLDPHAPAVTAQMSVVAELDDDEADNGRAGTQSDGDKPEGKSRKRRKRR